MIGRTILSVLSGLAAMTVLGGLIFAADQKPKTESERLAKGKDLIDSVCFWCHEPERMETQHLAKKEWASLLKGMIYEGPPVTDDEFEMIVEYLAKHYGPEPEEGTGEQK